MMDARSIRNEFLNFFKNKGHEIVPSAPLVVKNDPTLMFTNAGMNQFKDYFLGTRPAPYPRAADTQKCLRVSGKHNDLEEVGHDTYHHTMFEMLGNWSFGDYFKEEALRWSWELLTEVYKLPANRLYVSVFGGDTADGLAADEEARRIWRTMVPDGRILDGDKKDNFWEMGDTGPCGPCSEIHIDLRPDEEVAQQPGRALVNQDHPQVVEVWNNVFIEFNRRADGTLEPLPAKHVDTGMGFERLCMAIQGKTSNYDTDVFQPLIRFVANRAGKKYGQDERIDIALRVVADHVRAIAFAIADGQLPSNNKAGYVIRRILRRAVRYGYTFLGFRDPFLYALVPLLAEQFEGVFPELTAQRDFISKAIQEEEANFLRTLEVGLRRLDAIEQEVKAGGGTAIDGATAFELYDTFGFPLDLTALIARERGLRIDEAGFEAEMAQQKARSRAAATVETGDWTVLDAEAAPTFMGYDRLETTTHLLRYRAVAAKKKQQYQLVLAETPFYAESGGQVGDTGHLEVGGERLRVLDTRKENDLIIHLVDKLPTAPNAEVCAVVDAARRGETTNNHTATHLLHAALREVLGDHVAQKGSLVSDQVLRFDFSHFAKMTDEELTQVEAMVNERIRQNIPLDERRHVPIDEAKAMGATALFGEKYGDFVRVITFDPNYSVELCGGTHVPATGQIGYLKIVSESSVAAGVRRIEAYSAARAEAYVRDQEAALRQVRDLLKNPKDLARSVTALLEERAHLNKQLERAQQQQTQQLKADLLRQAERTDGVTVIVAPVEAPSADALKALAFELKGQVDNLFLVLGAEVGGKPLLAVMIADALVQSRGLHAGNLVRELAREIKGGGGGQPFFATAGGKDAAGLPRALERAREALAATSS